MPLTLSILGISVTLSRFADDAYPRIGSDGDVKAALAYTATGSIVGLGAIYEPHYSFNVNCFCSPDEQDLLDLIWTVHDYQRRQRQDCNILVSDTTRPIKELLPRSRGVAEGTEAIETAIGLVSYASYYATFYCWMPEPPVFAEKGKNRAVSFVLHESERTEP